MEAIKIIVYAKGLIIDQKDGVYYVKTKEEKEAEPTESAFYTFCYATAEKVAAAAGRPARERGRPAIRSAHQHHLLPRGRLEPRRHQALPRDRRSAHQAGHDRGAPVEVTANPKQSYGFNWAGVVGSSCTPQTFSYGGSTPGDQLPSIVQTNPVDRGGHTRSQRRARLPTATTTAAPSLADNFLLNAQSGIGGLLQRARRPVRHPLRPADVRSRCGS